MLLYSDALPVSVYDLLQLKIPSNNAGYQRFLKAWQKVLPPALGDLAGMDTVVSAKVLGEILESMCLAVKYQAGCLCKNLEAFEDRTARMFAAVMRLKAKRPLDSTAVLDEVGEVPSVDLTGLAADIQLAAQDSMPRKLARVGRKNLELKNANAVDSGSILLAGIEGDENPRSAQRLDDSNELAALNQLWEDELSQSLNIDALHKVEPTEEFFPDSFGHSYPTDDDLLAAEQGIINTTHNDGPNILIKVEQDLADPFVEQPTELTRSSSAIGGLSTPMTTPRKNTRRKVSLNKKTVWTDEEIRARGQAYLNTLNSMPPIKKLRIPLLSLFEVPNYYAKLLRKSRSAAKQTQTEPNQRDEVELPKDLMQILDDPQGISMEVDDQDAGFDQVFQDDDGPVDPIAVQRRNGSLNLSEDLSIYNYSIDPVSRGKPYQRPEADGVPYMETSEIYEGAAVEADLLQTLMRHPGSIEFDELLQLSRLESHQSPVDESTSATPGDKSLSFKRSKAELFLGLLTLSQEGKINLVQMDPYQSIWIDACPVP